MRSLKVCLWVAAVACLISVAGLFLPISVFESLANRFGMEACPDLPMTAYAIRVMSATFVAVGAFLVILARAPMRYGVMVPFSGVAAVLLGIVCGVAGLMSEMPLVLFAGDALFCIVFGVLILFFWRRARSAIV